jgi:hypothetical protein
MRAVNASHASHIKRHHHASRFASLQAAGNIRPATERNDDDIVVGRCPQRHQNIVFVLGIEHEIRSALGHAPPHAKQVAKALAVGVNHPLTAAVADLVGAHPQAQFSQETFVPNRVAQPHSFERDGLRIKLVFFYIEHRLGIGPQTGMGTRVEADFFVSPPPPFHVRGRIHSVVSIYDYDIPLSLWVFGFWLCCATAGTEIVVGRSSSGNPAKPPVGGFLLSPRMRCSSNSTAAFRTPRASRGSDKFDVNLIGSPKRTVAVPIRGMFLPFGRIL